MAIVGAGPSGCEAAWACVAAGLDTLLVTTSMDTMYNLIGEGWRLNPPPDTLMERLHRELADDDGWVGTWELHRGAKQTLERQARLHVLQSSVSALHIDDGQVVGVATWEGVDRYADRVALAVGTFLAPRLRIGAVTEVAGKLSEMAYDDLYRDLLGHGFGFDEVVLETTAGHGGLPYSVRCHAFSAAESDGHRLVRVRNLYATGLCRWGEVRFERAAADGRELGLELASNGTRPNR